MRGASRFDVTEARVVLEALHVATGAADPKVLAPNDWIKRYTTVIRTVAAREDQYRYRLDGFYGITMGRLHRNVAELLHDFDGLVEDNPRLRDPDITSARTREL